MVSANPSGAVRTRTVLGFLALAFGISWTEALVFAHVVRRRHGESIRTGCGGVALLATGACVVHDRYVAAERLTSRGPLTPWSRYATSVSEGLLGSSDGDEQSIGSLFAGPGR